MTGTTLQKYAAVPRRARIQGSKTFVSLSSRLEGNKEEEENVAGTKHSQDQAFETLTGAFERFCWQMY